MPTAPEEWPLSYTGVIPVAVKAALKGARTRFPNVTILDIMGAASPPLSYHQVKMGPGGSCMDYLVLGQCKNRSCTFKHSGDQVITDAQAAKAAPKLKGAYEKYAAAN